MLNKLLTNIYFKILNIITNNIIKINNEVKYLFNKKDMIIYLLNLEVEKEKIDYKFIEKQWKLLRKMNDKVEKCKRDYKILIKFNDYLVNKIRKINDLPL